MITIVWFPDPFANIYANIYACMGGRGGEGRGGEGRVWGITIPCVDPGM